MLESTRRDFLKETGTAIGAVGAVGTWRATALADRGKDVLRVGVIGCGGMGSNHIKLLSNRKDVAVAYVCDVDEQRLARAVETVTTNSGTAPKGVKDLREVLADKNIAAVWVATPDHWHGPAAILACEAGKHVYVEKPCSHNIREGRLMVEAARKHKRVVQVGTQARSTEHVVKAMELLREGVIGEVLIAKAWNSQRRSNIGKVKPSDPPKTFDYDLWTGPAPAVPFQTNRHHYTWHWWYDFGTGDMGNDGVHELDIARWGLGVTTHPNHVAALGGKYVFDDDQQFPDTQYVVFEYGDEGKIGSKRQLIYEHRIWSPYFQEGYENGNAFYGTKGALILGKGGGWKVIKEKNEPGPTMAGTVNLPAHHDNFLDCVQTGKPPNGDIEIGHFSATLCHLGNLAVRVGRTLHFDPKEEKILDDQEANKLVRRAYRDGHWAVPK